MVSEHNKYCALASLKNESDVEQFFILPWLVDLGYTSDYLETKTTSRERNGREREKAQAVFP